MASRAGFSMGIALRLPHADAARLSLRERFDPRFVPDLTPKRILALGVFGGKHLTNCRDEFRWCQVVP
jgi:hypothetical protein